MQYLARYPGKKRNAALWVSVIYFAEGFPYTIVNLMSVIFLKDLGASNEVIGLTSFLYLPWALKGLWGPMVDIYSTKRTWVLSAEIVCAFLFVLLAIGVLSPHAIALSVGVFALIAFASATHDIAIDGFYLDALDKEEQALFVGVRSTAYKVAWLAGNGGLVFLAGYLADQHLTGTRTDGTRIFENIRITLLGNEYSLRPLEFGWAAAFGAAAIIIFIIYLFQAWYLPRQRISDRISTRSENKRVFFEAFRTYLYSTQNWLDRCVHSDLPAGRCSHAENGPAIFDGQRSEGRVDPFNGGHGNSVRNGRSHLSSGGGDHRRCCHREAGIRKMDVADSDSSEFGDSAVPGFLQNTDPVSSGSTLSTPSNSSPTVSESLPTPSS